MRSKLLFAGLLALCTSLVQAAPAEWSFTYTGFYSKEQDTFLPNWTLSGSFAGEDLNHDGVLVREELTSLRVGYVDYITCESNEYHNCSTKDFSFQLPGSTLKAGMSSTMAASPHLAFTLGFDSHDPEWYVGAGRSITTGLSDYSFTRDPGSFVENTYSWRAETVLTVSEGVAPVPEPSTWAMLAAGVAVLALRQRRKGAAQRG
ncbi:MAG: PEP-CTERM sorting domain-containing protein [Gammaproteobacteria bacterium]